MPTFVNAREAKEFLIAEINNVAKQEGRPLERDEIEILHCPGPSQPDEKLPQDWFDNEDALDEFENRMMQLIRTHVENPTTDLDSWDAAVASLQPDDDYLLLLIRADQPTPHASRNLFFWLRVLLAAVAFGIVYFGLRAFHAGR